jgi:hypothetical protein
VGTFDDLGVTRAAIKLTLAQSLGTTVTLSHRGAAAATLYVRVLRETNERASENGIETELRVLTLEVPTQSGFARTATEAEPVTPGDLVTYLARAYLVLAPVEKDAGGFVYTLRCVERKRLAAGV